MNGEFQFLINNSSFIIYLEGGQIPEKISDIYIFFFKKYPCL